MLLKGLIHLGKSFVEGVNGRQVGSLQLLQGPALRLDRCGERFDRGLEGFDGNLLRLDCDLLLPESLLLLLMPIPQGTTQAFDSLREVGAHLLQFLADVVQGLVLLSVLVTWIISGTVWSVKTGRVRSNR